MPTACDKDAPPAQANVARRCIKVAAPCFSLAAAAWFPTVAWSQPGMTLLQVFGRVQHLGVELPAQLSSLRGSPPDIGVATAGPRSPGTAAWPVHFIWALMTC